MFSRALTRAARTAAPRTAGLTRSFNSSPLLKQAAAPAAASTSADGPGAVVQKYGAYTFWGMVASILVTKEVFIIDAEWLLSMEIGAFVATGYVLTGDQINKMSEDMDKEKTDKFNAANDFMLELFNQYKLVQGVAGDKPAVLESYLKEYKEAIVAHAAYQTVLPRHKARAAALASLEQIKAKEEHAASMEWQATVDKACANVNAAFAKGDKKLNDQMLQLAISNMGFSAPTTDEKNDPVKALFMKEFA